MGWAGEGGQVVLHSNAEATLPALVANMDDLLSGKLVLWRDDDGTAFGITPTFIRGAFPHSIVYLSNCRGAWNATMVNAFLSQGAAAVLAYSDYVLVSFTLANGPAVFERMGAQNVDLGTAFIPGIVERGPGEVDPAEFRMFGSPRTSLGQGYSGPSSWYHPNSACQCIGRTDRSSGPTCSCACTCEPNPAAGLVSLPGIVVCHGSCPC